MSGLTSADVELRCEAAPAVGRSAGVAIAKGWRCLQEFKLGLCAGKHGLHLKEELLRRCLCRIGRAWGLHQPVRLSMPGGAWGAAGRGQVMGDGNTHHWIEGKRDQTVGSKEKEILLLFFL